MFILSKLALVTISALLCYVLVKSRLAKPTWRLPPGPKPVWHLGNVYTFYKLNAQPNEACAELAARWGDLTTLWVGPWPVIMINSPDAAYDLLQKKAASTSSRPMHNDFRFEMLPSRIVVTPAGKMLRSLRGLHNTWLQRSNLSMFRRHEEDESRKLVGSIAASPGGFRKSCDNYAINALFRAIYGFMIDDEDSISSMYSIWGIVYLYFLPGTLPFDYVPSLLWLPKWAQPWRTIVQCLKHKELSLHRPAWKCRKSSGNTNPETSLQLEAILHRGVSTKKEQSQMIRANDTDIADYADPPNEVLDILAMLLGAGSDTVSAFLQVFFKLAALHPEETLKAQSEILEAVGNETLPTWEDEERLPYVRAYIKEIHRWAPIAPIGIPHATSEEIVYQNFVIPRGTILIPNIASLHQSPKHFPEPQIFRPERYLTDSSNIVYDGAFSYRGHCQYGFGRRMCPGSDVAESTIYIAVVRILWAFDISAPQDTPLAMSDQRKGLLRKPLPFRLNVKCRGQHVLDALSRT